MNAEHSNTGLPIAIISGVPTDADNPGPVPIVVRVIVISIVMPTGWFAIRQSKTILGRSVYRERGPRIWIVDAHRGF